jgi:hypothetical protein
MATIWLDKDPGGWRHKIDDDPVYCGALIEVKVGREWVSGRYESDLGEARPVALLYVANDRPPLRIEEFTEARFPARA